MAKVVKEVLSEALEVDNGTVWLYEINGDLAWSRILGVCMSLSSWSEGVGSGRRSYFRTPFRYVFMPTTTKHIRLLNFEPTKNLVLDILTMFLTVKLNCPILQLLSSNPLWRIGKFQLLLAQYHSQYPVVVDCFHCTLENQAHRASHHMRDIHWVHPSLDRSWVLAWDRHFSGT
jgi:hypothetical protein